MACGNCGHAGYVHRVGCAVYTTQDGWCRCRVYTSGGGTAAPAVHLKGQATARQLITDTQKFRDKSVQTAAAKARKVR